MGSRAYEDGIIKRKTFALIKDRTLFEVLHAFAILQIEKSDRFCVSFPAVHFLVSYHFSAVELKVPSNVKINFYTVYCLQLDSAVTSLFSLFSRSVHLRPTANTKGEPQKTGIDILLRYVCWRLFGINSTLLPST